MFPVVVLNSLLTNSPVSAEQPIAASGILTVSGTRLWSESEVVELIGALTDAAHEAVETAAGEAAKAAAIASLQSQAAALSEAARWEREYKNLKSNSVKTAWTVGAVSFSVGAFVGVSAVFFFMRR
jgi:hypothetical protein